MNAISTISEKPSEKSKIRRWIEIPLGALGIAAIVAAGVTACAVEADKDDKGDPSEPEIANVEPETGEAEEALTATAANLKVAFVGDTSTGSNFQSVLKLVKDEGASALFVQGDMSYSGNASGWWDAVDSVLGTSFPVFIAQGNHDVSSWSKYLPRAAQHLGGATRVQGDHDAQYKTTFKGLVAATIKKGDSASKISSFLANDTHLWKLCLWHENQRAMQIGGKTDEMGWPVYEECRKQGAIIVTAHEHSYERTKTLSSMQNQTISSSCNGQSDLCVGSGRTFVTVSGLGGNSVRDQERCTPTSYPYGCNGVWGSIYANQQGATYGAQFITFYVDGNAKKARGYFKNINGKMIDSFTIVHD